MNINECLQTWKSEEQQPFSGWDFSYLDGRMLEDQHPWSYSSRAAELMHGSSSVLDMGTGGGERFLKLLEYWPKKVVATEEYPPNVKLAKERLAPFGAKVVDFQLTLVGQMPFADGEFELVLNRHSGFNPREVARILAAGGTFLTQQVHGLWVEDLLALFDARPQWPMQPPGMYIPELESAGWASYRLEEWSGRLVFTDVGAIVYYLKAVPWLVPGFRLRPICRTC